MYVFLLYNKVTFITKFKITMMSCLFSFYPDTIYFTILKMIKITIVSTAFKHRKNCLKLPKTSAELQVNKSIICPYCLLSLTQLSGQKLKKLQMNSGIGERKLNYRQEAFHTLLTTPFSVASAPRIFSIHVRKVIQFL